MPAYYEVWQMLAAALIRVKMAARPSGKKGPFAAPWQFDIAAWSSEGWTFGRGVRGFGETGLLLFAGLVDQLQAVVIPD
jgi:hypothetical protein